MNLFKKKSSSKANVLQTEVTVSTPATPARYTEDEAATKVHGLALRWVTWAWA